MTGKELEEWRRIVAAMRRVRRVVVGFKLDCMVLRAGVSSFNAWDEDDE